MAKLKRRGISILGRLRNYFIAGIVKGVIGIGLPTTSITIMTFFSIFVFIPFIRIISRRHYYILRYFHVSCFPRDA